MQDTIENIYLMPFRLLGKFGTKKTILKNTFEEDKTNQLFDMLQRIVKN